MSLTFTKQKEGVAGDLRYWSGTITGDSSYTTNGYAITAANFGFSSVIYMMDLSATSGLLFEFDKANSKIKAYYPTGGGATGPTALAVPTVAPSSGGTAMTSTSAQPAMTVTPGQAKEVPNTANLAAVVIQAFVLGQ